MIIEAVIKRYTEVFPEWEVMFLSLPRGDADACIRELNRILEFIKKHGGR